MSTLSISEKSVSAVDESSMLLKLPRSLEVGTLEKKLLDFFCFYGPQIDNIVFDMRACVFVEVASLVRIISLVTDRQRKGLKTHIALPEAKRVRDFMRLWNFPGAISKASDVPFSNVVLHEDHKYFGENKRPEDSTYRSRFTCEGEPLLSDTFFAFLTQTVTKGNYVTSTVLRETKRWEDEFVKSILRKHLSGPENYIPSRIVYELISNACRHPNCSLIQIVSRFESSSSDPNTSPDHFTIIVWDDGESMFDTLKRPLTECASIGGNCLKDVYRFKVKYVNADGTTSTETVPTDFLPNETTEDHLILLSTLLPGITRDPSGKGHSVHPDLVGEGCFTFPGMGLFVLINATVDVFGGSVAFRTGRFFMNIKAPIKSERKIEKVDYLAKIEEYDKRLPVFLGNMLTIRLPIKK